MTAITDFFLRRSFLVNVITVAVIVVGIITGLSMDRDLIPPFQFNMVQVHVSLPGATPEEMEKYVTFPIEDAIKGTVGVEKVKSVSTSSVSEITIFYEAGYAEMVEAPNRIEAKINSLRARLPQGIRSLLVQRIQINDMFLFALAFQGMDDTDLKHRIFFKNFVKLVTDIDGVINVKEGMKKRDVYVELDQDKLNKFGVTVSEVRSTLSKALNFSPIGQARIGVKKFVVKIDKLADNIDEINELPVRGNLFGRTVFIKDIALVQYRNEEGYEADFINGDKSVFAIINKDVNSDIIDLKPKVVALIDEFNAKAPDGVKIVNVVDGAHFVQQQLDVVSRNGLVGFAIVFLLLLIFLNWRTAIMTCMGLPVAYAGTLIFLDFVGVKIDLISLIGMILVVGILVDDAIIVAERYMEYLSQGLDSVTSARRAVKDLIVPVTGTVLTTLVAFSPLLLIKSEMSNVLFAIPAVVITALIMSFLESFLILPNHLAHFVKKPKDGHMVNAMERLKRLYEKMLHGTLKYRYPVFALVLVLLGVVGWIGATKIKHDFNLAISSEKVQVTAILKQSDSMAETRNSLLPIEKYMMGLVGEGNVEYVHAEVGSIWHHGRKREGYKFAQVTAYLDRNHPYPSRIKNSMKSKIEKKLKELKNDKFEELTVDISRQGGEEDKKNMVSVRITGAEDVDFSVIESSVTKAVVAQKGVSEYVEDKERYQDSWVFVPDLRKINQYKIDHQHLARQIRGYFTPDEVIETRISGENVFVYTQFKEVKTLMFSQLNKLEIIGPRETSIPLSFLGEWRRDRTLKKISHYDGRRNLKMNFKVTKESNSTMAKQQMRAALEPVGVKFPTYQIEVIDADEKNAKSQAWAMKIAFLCIGGVLLVIALILGSLTQPLIVGLPIPFGLIGIILALYFHGLPLGLMALVGLIGTVGVSVNASIVLVDHINRLSKNISGRIPRDIFIKGASDRLRAILLTTVTTLGGVFPMAYSLGGESGFTQPLAFSMGWGLTFATLLTLFLLPALLEIREDFLGFGRFLSRKIGFESSQASMSISEISPQDPENWVEIGKNNKSEGVSQERSDETPNDTSPLY